MGSAAKQLGIVERRTKVCGVVCGRVAAQLMCVQGLDMALPRCKQRRTMRCRLEKIKGTVQGPVSVHNTVLCIVCMCFIQNE